MKNSLKNLSRHYPMLFFPIFKIWGSKKAISECMLNNDTELVIEGFPRCANTFSVVAFRFAQARHVHIAHHLHAEAQILEGVKRELPVIVLIRHPKDAIKSLLIRHPESNEAEAIKRYIHFYSAVKTVKKSVVIAEFNVVVSDFGKIIESLNDKYSKNFDSFIHNDNNVATVYEEIDQINGQLDDGKWSHVARPSKEREELTESMKLNLSSNLMQEAIALYEDLLVKD